ncbi:hypothetical protein PO367_03900 [Bacteroides ovatus]|uniref:hypothetical protein n=1 Tax=Bacteroides ovatus TaxID=28116 RepID=UPI00233E653D|nr:hypothetical protein [Bacteroides ovatus]MDC2747223.1 hypothetical protein [Bacteroides ovatus]MDC2756868.1 hypothetical protein [Bacteroides ovatus]
MKSLGTPQHIMWLTYLDCKKRTKKEIKFPKETKGISHDEELVHFMLENSSIVERQGERSYHRVYDAIDVMCKQLCPGEWCTRTHCEHYSRRHAYNCIKTRPKVCKKYAKYIADKVEREKHRNKIKDMNRIQELESELQLQSINNKED